MCGNCLCNFFLRVCCVSIQLSALSLVSCRLRFYVRSLSLLQILVSTPFLCPPYASTTEGMFLSARYTPIKRVSYAYLCPVTVLLTFTVSIPVVMVKT